jgi:uncharacterized protein
VTSPGGPYTYLVVDGENIDATLGGNVLGRRPQPDERPRWERVREFAERQWGQPVKGLFFLNASSGQLPTGYRPIPLAGDSTEKVVDIGIQRTLEALRDREGDVLLASHDGDFLESMAPLLDGERRVGVLGFREFVNQGFQELVAKGLTVFDLEDDVRAFNEVLPRVRIIPIEDFDPLRYL